MTATPSEKMRLREQYRAARHAISAADAATAALAIRDHFLGGIEMTAKCAVAGTLPLPGEVDPTPLMRALHENGHPLCLPAMPKRTGGPGKPLAFRAYAPGDPLAVAAFGVREPGPEMDILTPAVVLTPLIAVDRAGNRLGQGGGFYDRTMSVFRAALHPPRFIGLAYAAQVIDSLPHDRFDQPLDGVVTEEGVTLFS